MARRHTSTAKIPARAGDDADDVFIGTTLAMGGWAQRNRQLLVAGGIALAVLLAGLLYYMNYRGGHLERAAVDLERVQQGVAFGDTATAKVELARYIESFGNTPYADEARLLLGELYLASNQTEQAVEVLARSADVSEPIGLQIALLLAKAHEQGGSLDEAERLLLRAADRAELEFQSRDALEEAARIRRGRGNLAGAAELYQRILDDLDETSPQRGMYEMRLEELRVQTATG